MKKLIPLVIFLAACVTDNVPSRSSVPIPQEVYECQTQEFSYEVKPISVDSNVIQFIHKTVSSEHTQDVSQFDFEQIYVKSATIYGDPDLGFIDWIRIFVGDEAILWLGSPSGKQEEMSVDGTINIANYFRDNQLKLKGVSRGHAPSKDTEVWMVINLVTVDQCPQNQTVIKNNDIEQKNSP